MIRILYYFINFYFNNKNAFQLRVHTARSWIVSPYLVVSHTHSPGEQPHMPPPAATMHNPPSNHACPPPRATTHAPPVATMHNPPSNHACPPQSNHACPLEQPHMPPWEQPCMPPRVATHAQPTWSNHAHPHPPGTTTHAPQSNHAPCMPNPPLPGATTHTPHPPPPSNHCLSHC